jgi:anti-anti-sigma factor
MDEMRQRERYAGSGIAVERTFAGVGTIVLRGEHDEYTSPKLGKTIASVLAKGLDVMVDLREAEFLDSTSVAALLAGQENAALRDAGFVVVLDDAQTGWAVRRLFEIARLSSILTIVSTPEQALAHLRERIAFTRAERRGSSERRSGRDRRLSTRPVGLERRSGDERREGRDRRQQVA